METVAISGYGVDIKDVIEASEASSDAKLKDFGKVMQASFGDHEEAPEYTDDLDNWIWSFRADILAVAYPNRPLSVYHQPCNMDEYYIYFADVSVFADQKYRFANTSDADLALAQDMVIDYVALKAGIDNITPEKVLKLAKDQTDLVEKLVVLFNKTGLCDDVSDSDLC